MSKRIVIPLLALSLTVASGCRWERRHSGGAAIGGLGGAALGALIGGAAAGEPGTGAVIGAAGGLLAGYLIADATGPDEYDRYPPSRQRVYRDLERDPVPAPAPTPLGQGTRAEADDFFRQGLWAENDSDAEYAFKRSIEAYPTPAAYNNLGLLYLRQGYGTRARRMWDQALALDPNFQPARDNLARLDAA